MSRSRFALLLAASGIIAVASLTACSSATGSPANSDASHDSPASEEPPSDSPQIGAKTLNEIFTSTQFDPEAFDTTEAMLASIYPGVTASPACLAVLGVSTTTGTSPNSSANVVFGPSIDRSMTAQISSFEADADEYFSRLSKSADECIADPQVTFQGQAVDVTVQRSEIHQTAFSLQLAGQIMGNQVSVVGIVEQFDASVVAVAGWDPRSSSQTVPAATGMFVEKLSEARIELINQAG